MKGFLDLFVQVPVTSSCQSCFCSWDSWLHPTWTCGVLLLGGLELDTLGESEFEWLWNRGHNLPVECLTTLPPSWGPTNPVFPTQLSYPTELELCGRVSGALPAWAHSIAFVRLWRKSGQPRAWSSWQEFADLREPSAPNSELQEADHCTLPVDSHKQWIVW